MVRFVRTPLIAGGVLTLLLSWGFSTYSAWATWLWPTPDGPLFYKFIAAMQAVIAKETSSIKQKTRPGKSMRIAWNCWVHQRTELPAISGEAGREKCRLVEEWTL